MMGKVLQSLHTGSLVRKISDSISIVEVKKRFNVEIINFGT